jgi:endonuclease/exonuclease/phosphatase family metal-dependent hydrolase
MVTRFLFWNVNRKGLEPLVAQLAHERASDVVILAECRNAAKVLQELNQSDKQQYKYHPSYIPVKELEIFSNFTLEHIASLGDNPGLGLTFRKLQPSTGIEILLVGAHLSSKRHSSSHDQMLESTHVITQINNYENGLGHRRTVVVGDLNMDPFEQGLVGAHGLHAIGSRSIAQRAERTVKGESYPFFYNPMWNHLGDNREQPQGTYYYDSSQSVNYYWHTFDQVLVRPALLPNFTTASVEIISSVGGQTLLRPSGQPNRALASDHLPISFELNLAEGSNEPG